MALAAWEIALPPPHLCQGVRSPPTPALLAVGNFSFKNITIETRYAFGTQWWGSGEALVVTSIPENPAQMAHGLPGIHGVVFEDIQATAEGGCLFSSQGQDTTAPHAIDGLVLRNVNLAIGRSAGAATHPQLDYRPVDAGGGAPNTVAADVVGLVFAGVAGAVIEGGSVSFVGPPQPYWAGPGHVGLCVAQRQSANVTLTGMTCTLAAASD